MANTAKKLKTSKTWLEPFLVLLMIAAIFALLGSPVAYGAAGMGNQSLINPLPAGVIYPTPVGILYPGFNVAAGVNAAALSMGKRVTAAQLSVAPALQTGASMGYLASIATSTNRLGWSVGYVGASGGAASTHGIYAGAGFTLARVSMGVGLRDTDIASAGFSFDPSVDFGTRIDLGKDFAFGTVVYNLEQTPGVSTGFGFGRKKKENIEINFLIPSLGSSDYATTFMATVYSGRFGTTFRTTYYLSSKAFSHTLGALLWLGQKMNVVVQLTSPSTMTFGLTYVF